VEQLRGSFMDYDMPRASAASAATARRSALPVDPARVWEAIKQAGGGKA
jgi:hypothetical protein